MAILSLVSLLVRSPRWRHRGRVAPDRQSRAARPLFSYLVCTARGKHFRGLALVEGATDDQLQTATAGGRVHGRNESVLSRGGSFVRCHLSVVDGRATEAPPP